MKTRRFGNYIFRCIKPGLWMTVDRIVLREEFKGMLDYHDWVAERWHNEEDFHAVEHYGTAWSMKEAAETLPYCHKY